MQPHIVGSLQYNHPLWKLRSSSFNAMVPSDGLPLCPSSMGMGVALHIFSHFFKKWPIFYSNVKGLLISTSIKMLERAGVIKICKGDLYEYFYVTQKISIEKNGRGEEETLIKTDFCTLQDDQQKTIHFCLMLNGRLTLGLNFISSKSL